MSFHRISIVLLLLASFVMAFDHQIEGKGDRNEEVSQKEDRWSENQNLEEASTWSDHVISRQWSVYWVNIIDQMTLSCNVASGKRHYSLETLRTDALDSRFRIEFHWNYFKLKFSIRQFYHLVNAFCIPHRPISWKFYRFSKWDFRFESFERLVRRFDCS